MGHMMVMTDIHIRFCEGILRGESQSSSYLKAGFNTVKGASARSRSSVLMKEPIILAYLAERRREIAEQSGVTPERIIKELERVAFSNLRDFMSWDDRGVAFIPSEYLTEAQAAAIMSIKSKRRVTTDDEDRVTETVELELKAHPKMDAIEKLNKIFGLYQAERMNDADREANLLATVLWRYVMNVHLHEGLPIPEALARAEKDPEEVHRWGKEVMLIPDESSS